MRLIRITYRGIALILLIISGLVLSLLFQRGDLPPRSFAAALGCGWHRTFARAMGIRVQVQGSPEAAHTLFVSNHVSWFDITALGGVLRSRFLSKAEVRNWPVAGWLATRAGTLYIRRGGKAASARANRAMAEALARGQNVVLFAEGTTTSGHTRKFHSRLMQCAVDTGATVQPVAIHYPLPESRRDEFETQVMHPDALFIDDMTFGESMLRMLGARDIEVRIVFCDPMPAGGRTRDELAREAEDAVRRALGYMHETPPGKNRLPAQTEA